MTDYTHILNRLDVVDGSGPWHARCPTGRHTHGDRRPSLRLWVCPETDKLRCKCYGGCTFQEIAAVVGLPLTAWFPPQLGLSAWKNKLAASGAYQVSIEKTYDYHDADGKLSFQVCRTKTLQNQKGFFQRRPVPGRPPEEWAVGLHQGTYKLCFDSWWRSTITPREDDKTIILPQCKIVLYGLPLLLAHPEWPVIVVEGEKDADTINALFGGKGTLATTAPMGAGKWPLQFGGFLAGRRVVVMPDNDEQGLEHALRVIGSAVAYGAESVRWIRWGSETPQGWDITDWLDGKHAGCSNTEKRKAVGQLILGSQLWAAKAA